MLAEAMGITEQEGRVIEEVVEQGIRERWNMIQLFTTVGEMDISDELWANFLYTYGWWDGRRNA